MTSARLEQDFATAVEWARAGRMADAAALLSGHAAAEDAPDAVLDVYAQVLQALGRDDERADVRLRLRDRKPASVAAEHNLAAAWGDAGLHAASEQAARAVFAKGGDAPETWLVLGRALQGLGRLDDAAEAFRQAVRRRPAYLEALRDEAQLIWMRTGDLGRASVFLDEAISAVPSGALRAVKARLHEYAGDARGAYQVMLDGAMDAAAHAAAARSAIHFDPATALDHARQAVSLAPGDAVAVRDLIEAFLANGLAEDADRALAPLLEAQPLDQQLLALRATAWRLMGDPRAADLYDYDRMVRGWVIDTPEDWPTLEAYLDDLAASLRRLHQLKAHPLDQSLRGGSQTTADLTRSDDPAVRAFFKAIDGPIRRHMAWLGQGGDPLRARNTGAYRIAGAWSVQLQPNGFHADHFHGRGWLSSACYIALPGAVESRGREGWIKFGQPGPPTRPRLEPQHYIQPRPGLLALFPSYMWHGTVPFSGEDTRLTIAFDVVPA